MPSLLRSNSLPWSRNRSDDDMVKTERSRHRRQRSSPMPSLSVTPVSVGPIAVSGHCSAHSPRATTHHPRNNCVKFCDVYVREYEVIASDNPSVNSGAALELGWNYNTCDPQCIEEYEALRAPNRKDNYSAQILNRRQRETLLREFGFSDKEILQVAKSADAIRKNRAKSQHHDQLLELGESVSNAWKWAKKKSSFRGSQHSVDKLSSSERSYRVRSPNSLDRLSSSDRSFRVRSPNLEDKLSNSERTYRSSRKGLA